MLIRRLASSSRIRDNRRAHVVQRDGGEVPFRIAGAQGRGMRANVSRFHVVALLRPRRIPRSVVSISAGCSWTNHCERQNYNYHADCRCYSFPIVLMIILLVS